MCQLVCQACQEPIAENEDTLEVLQGYVEKSEFVPEQEIAHFHISCYSRQDPFNQ